MKSLFIIATIVLVSIAPLRAQEWERINDTTWARQYKTNKGIQLEYAYPIDANQIVVDNNNAMREAGACFLGSIGCAVAAGTLVYVGEETRSSSIILGAIALGAMSLGLEIGGMCKLLRNRVYLTPEGVIVKIGKKDKSKYNKTMNR